MTSPGKRLKVLLAIIDGLGDRTFPELRGRTPLEAARKPNLDQLAVKASCGTIYPLGPGRIPASELAHFTYFGYRPEQFPGRAVLEGLGHGLDIPLGTVVTHVTLVGAKRTARGFEFQHSQRTREDKEEEMQALLEAVASYKTEGLRLRLRYLSRGQGLLEILGPADEWVTDSDPFFTSTVEHPVMRIEACQDARDRKAAERTARVLNAYHLWAHEKLQTHPINAARKKNGKPPLNFLVMKWAGSRREIPSFEQHTGMRGAIVASTPLYRGLAALAGMSFFEGKDPDPGKDLREKLDRGLELLRGGFDFVHVHTKEADEAAHRQDPDLKRRVIESLDSSFGVLLEPAALDDLLVVITADHSTPSRGPRLHGGDSVPIMVLGETARRDEVASFGERSCVVGSLGQLAGQDLMPVLLNLACRGAFLGSRPSSVSILSTPVETSPLVP